MNDWLDVHALVDGELSEEDRPRVQERIKTSKQSMAEWHAVRQIKAVLVSKCAKPDCEEVWKACTKRLRQIDRTKRAEFFVGRYAWAICGLFFAVILGAATLNRLNGGGIGTGDVARVSASLVPISAPRSQAPDDQRKWLQDNLSKTMQLQPGRLSVVGGAMGHLPDGRRVARADLQDSEGPLNLFVIERADALDDVEQVDGHNTYAGGTFAHENCVSWSREGNEFLLVGDRPVDELCQIGDALNARQ